MTVNIGLALPSFVEDPEIPIAVARAAEAAGLDGVFVYDHLVAGRPAEPASGVRVLRAAGCGRGGDEPGARRHAWWRARRSRPPATLANSFATAQRVSGGRLIAAIGAGDSQSRAENEAFGLEFRDVGRSRRRAARRGAGRVGRRLSRCGSAVAPRRCARSSRSPTAGTRGAPMPEQFADQGALVRAIAPKADAHVGRARPSARRRCERARPIACWPYAEAGATWIIVGPDRLERSDQRRGARRRRAAELLTAAPSDALVSRAGARPPTRGCRPSTTMGSDRCSNR